MSAINLYRSFPLLLSLIFITSGLSAFASHRIPEENALSRNPSAATYKDVRAFMQRLVQEHPQTTRLFTLGESDSGLPIEGLEIGTGPVHNLVVATHHGNEYGSTEVARAFAASISQDPIRGQTVYVVPVLNIAGYDRKYRREAAKGQSFDHDPNRDYPGPCGTEGPHLLKDTAALAAFIDTKQIVTSATLHTYYPAVVYPWGIPSHDLSTPYDDLFKQLTQSAAVESGYQVGNSTEVIYPASGTYEDYAFWKHGVWSILFELGYTHAPDLSQVQELVRLNVPGLRRMFEQAPTQRADKHLFSGKCDARLRLLDRHDE